MVNADLASALEGLFGSTTDSDCTIAFCLDSATTQDCQDEERPAKKARVDESDMLLAAPLPAHKLALRHVSERFRVQLERWQTDQEPGAGSSTPFILRVPLSSDAEVPAARAALKHAYTGRLEVGGVREAMEVRRQAAYLQILSCTAACDKYLKSLMQQKPTNTGKGTPAPASPKVGTGAGSTAGASTSGPPQPPVAPILELYACSSLWPSPDEDSGGFRQGVLAATRPALVAHFKDTLATLNSPALRQQLLELPPGALAALLESDDFGTDCEDSVLLLLATWMQANYSATDGPTRDRLCRLVRLAQLSRAYLTLVLPALAAEHVMHPDEPVGWFPVGVMEAAFITQYAAASKTERNLLARYCKAWDLQSPTYSLQPRAQGCSISLPWSIKGTDLEKALGHLKPGAKAKVEAELNGLSLHYVAYRGFRWMLYVICKPGATDAGLALLSSVPPQLVVGDDSQLKGPAGAASVIVDTGANAYARAMVNRVGTKDPRHVKLIMSPNVFGHSKYLKALPLQQPIPTSAGSGGRSGDGSEGNGGALAAFADYLQGGKMTGSLDLG